MRCFYVATVKRNDDITILIATRKPQLFFTLVRMICSQYAGHKIIIFKIRLNIFAAFYTTVIIVLIEKPS